MKLRFAAASLFALAASVTLTACGKARVPAPHERVESVSRVLELPYMTAPEKPPAEPPWHWTLSVQLDEMPANAAALKETIEQRRGPAYQAATGILGRIGEGVAANRPADANWSILTLELGDHKVVRNGKVNLNAALGLTKLYARRPEIGFQDVRLEDCMRSLALQSGLRFTTPKLMNPVLTWRRENISTIEAIDEILNIHNFSRKITGAYARVSLSAERFKSQDEFVEAAVQSILSYGKGIDRAVPALMIAPRGHAAPKEEEGEAPRESVPAPAPE